MFNTGGLTEAGSVTIANGKMETFGTTVEWYIRRVGDNEYVICPGENIHTYLSAETTTSSNIIMTYINQNGIPSRCKWQISSNRLINVATRKYLGINGSTLTSYDSAGTAGTVEGDKRIWRINTKNNVTSQELISLEPRSVLTILDNEARLESYTTSAANGTAYYIGANDFTYSGLPAGVMTYNYSTHKFSFINYPSSQSVYTITMTHKVTGISNTFKVVAKPNIMLVTINDPSHSDQHDEYFDYVEACYDDNLIFNEYVDCTRGEILSNITNKYNNVFVSFCHGDSVGKQQE